MIPGAGTIALLGDLRTRVGHRLRITLVVAAAGEARICRYEKKTDGREDVNDEPHRETPSPLAPARCECKLTIRRGSAARNTLDVVGSTRGRGESSGREVTSSLAPFR